MEAYNLLFNLFYGVIMYELSMECVLNCSNPSTGDSIDKIALNIWSKLQTNAKERRGLDKFGDDN